MKELGVMKDAVTKHSDAREAGTRGPSVNIYNL